MAYRKLHYQMIFKRKSFHIFKDTESISQDESNTILSLFPKLIPLCKNIKTEIVLVPSEQTTCKRGQEYCILFYSEQKDHYLQNIGYLGEQLDLYLNSMNIGVLWFGIGKVDEPKRNGLDYVIMMAIAKMPEDKFRKDMFKSKRKPLHETWFNNYYTDIGNIARFSPSACNTQPWITEGNQHELIVYRYQKPGKRGIMPKDKVAYYNRIDIGIYLYILETCMHHEGIQFDRTLYSETNTDFEKIPIAHYKLKTDINESI